MADVFVSYATEDRPRARLVARALERNGITVWWDRTILPGESFDQAIEGAIDAARCVLVLWSNHSVRSRWVRNEAGEGDRRSILVPAMLEDTQIPLQFRSLQAANLADWDGSSAHPELDTLLVAIRTTLGIQTTEAAGPVSAVGSVESRSHETAREPIRDRDQSKVPLQDTVRRRPSHVQEVPITIEQPTPSVSSSVESQRSAEAPRPSFVNRRLLVALAAGAALIVVLLWKIDWSPSPESGNPPQPVTTTAAAPAPQQPLAGGPDTPAAPSAERSTAPPSPTGNHPKGASSDPIMPRAQTKGLRDGELAAVFASEYGDLHASTIAPGRFRLARHESSSRRLLKGELVMTERSSLGYLYYSAETIAGSGTAGDFGHLRYEGSAWNVYRLDSNGAEFSSSGPQIRTDGDTIAWYTKGSNFEEFTIWQRITGEQPADKYVARELVRMKTLVDELIAKRTARD